MRRISWALIAVAAASLAVPLWGADPVPDPQRPVLSPARQGATTLSKRSQLSSNFPCSQCHAQVDPENAGPIAGAPHREVVIDHFPGAKRCEVCHSYPDMERFNLVTRQKADFDASFMLCGECHSDVRKDWDLGLHGKSIGSWRTGGEKHRRVCVECHNAHAPRFPKMQAEPPPPFPRFGIRKSHGEHPTKGEHK